MVLGDVNSQPSVLLTSIAARLIMSDPLSVASAVIGIVVAGKELIELLYKVTAGIKDAPEVANAAVTELKCIEMVIVQLQSYVFGSAHASQQRRNLITIEHITATLTGCVVTYSDLKVVLSSLNVDSGMRPIDRAIWMLKKDKVEELIRRMQNNKLTFTLMLNILQCASMGEAESSMDRLCDKVNEVLRSNQELSMRLKNIEDSNLSRVHQSVALVGPSFNLNEVQPRRSQSLSSNASQDLVNSPGVGAKEEDIEHTLVPAIGNARSHFEEVLNRSRVYRHVSPAQSQFSMISDSRSTLAFSICSSVTLGEVSNISVFAIPIYTHELSNGKCYEIEPAIMRRMSLISTQSTGGDNIGSSSPKQRTRLTTWWRGRKQSLAARKEQISEPVPPIFGVNLQQSIRYSNVAILLHNDEGQSYIYGYVPVLVAKVCVFLKEKGTDVPNVFDVSGSPKRIKELQTIFDTPPRYGRGCDMSIYTVHDATSILLRFLYQLPEPVVPWEFYERFRAPFRDLMLVSSVEPEMIRIAQSLLDELPPVNRQLLLYLMDVLAVFASKQDVNGMSCVKLAAVLQPGILSHPTHRLQADEVALSHAVLVFLIENQDCFLISDSRNPTLSQESTQGETGETTGRARARSI